MNNAIVSETALLRSVDGHEFWAPYLVSVLLSRAIRIHLAVFVEPYLTYVLDGTKTIESRFTKRAGPPYQRVAAGDVVLLKKAGGRLLAVCRVSDAWFYELGPAAWASVEDRFLTAMRVSREFLRDRRSANYVSLMRLDDVHQIEPLRVSKRDRRGWVVVHDPLSPRDVPPETTQLSLVL